MEVRIGLPHFVIVLAVLVALGHCLHLKSPTNVRDSNDLANVDQGFASLNSNKKMVKRELPKPIDTMKSVESSTKLDNLIETNERLAITGENKESKTGSVQSFKTADVVTINSTPVSKIVSVSPTMEGSVGNATPIHNPSTSNKLDVNSKQILQASAFSSSHSDAAEKTMKDNAQTILSSTMIAATPTTRTEAIPTTQTDMKTGLSTKQLQISKTTIHHMPTMSGETTTKPSINPSKTTVHDVHTMSEMVAYSRLKVGYSMTDHLLVTKGLSTSTINSKIVDNLPSPHLSIMPTSINKVALVHSTSVPPTSPMPEKSPVSDLGVTNTVQVLSSRMYQKSDPMISSPQTEGLDSSVSSTVWQSTAQHGAGNDITESDTNRNDSVYATDSTLSTLINGDIYTLDEYSNSAKASQSSVFLHLASTAVTTSDIYGSVDTPYATPASTWINATATQESTAMYTALNVTTESESVTESIIANSTTKDTVLNMTDTANASVSDTPVISPEKSAAGNFSLNSSDVVSSPLSGIMFTPSSFVASSDSLDLSSEVVPYDTTSIKASSAHYINQTFMSSVLSMNQTLMISPDPSSKEPSMIPPDPSSTEPSMLSSSVDNISSQPLAATTVPIYSTQDSIQSTQVLMVSDNSIIISDNRSAWIMILETPSAGNHSTLSSESYTIIQATPSVDVIVTKYVPQKEGSTNGTKGSELSMSASFGIAAGCLIGFWLILGPIICIVCRCRDKSKDGRKSKANGHNHMENGITEAMIMKELHREYKEKDSPTLTNANGNGTKYHPLTEENTEIEALHDNSDSPIMFIDSD